MRTLSFIGSDKNAGKTTAFTYYYYQLYKRIPNHSTICLTSIGINGEPVDSYENEEKPAIRVFPNTLFITAGEHLSELIGLYRVNATFTERVFSKTYVLATALDSFNVILEGPNDKAAILEMKDRLEQLDNKLYCLIDGSIDRQFLGHPDISDGICFALLLSDRQQQLKKASDLLTALLMEQCNSDISTLIKTHHNEGTKSLLCSTNGELIYCGHQIPFLDEELKKSCLDAKDDHCVLYLDGSLAGRLYHFLAPFSRMQVVLDNYTCYQNISVQKAPGKTFKPGLFVFHSVPLDCLFIRQEANHQSFNFPVNIPVYDLFRDESHEIGI